MKVAVIGGDGIGPEVTDVALKALAFEAEKSRQDYIHKVKKFTLENPEYRS